MDTIEKLIKALEEAKADLNKNINCAPGSMNMGKADEVKPDKGYGKIIIKDTEPKPKDPKNPYGKIIRKEEDDKVNLNNPYNDQPHDKKKKKEEELEKDAANPALAPKEVKIKQLQAQIDAGTYKPDPKKIADKMLQKEELVCSENGQWDIVEKAVPGIDSKHIFSMDHIKQISEHKDHNSAKKAAHSAIDSSNARPENKMKARQMVDSSKNVGHLAQGMTNFHMAHDAKIRSRLSGKKD